LCATCPHEQISEQLLIEYLLDISSGGVFMDETPIARRYLISSIA